MIIGDSQYENTKQHIGQVVTMIDASFTFGTRITPNIFQKSSRESRGADFLEEGSEVKDGTETINRDQKKNNTLRKRKVWSMVSPSVGRSVPLVTVNGTENQKSQDDIGLE